MAPLPHHYLFTFWLSVSEIARLAVIDSFLIQENTLPSCFLCKQIVLGLEGQDDELETAILLTGDGALGACAYGPCHIECLVRSEWGRKWSDYRKRSLLQCSWIRVVSNREGLTTILNSKTSDLYIFEETGLQWRFKCSYAKELAQSEDRDLIRRYSSTYNLNLSDYESIAATVWTELKSAGRYPFINLANDLGIANMVRNPTILATSEIQFDVRLLEKWKAGWIVGRSLHHELIPQSVVRCIKNHLNSAD